MRSSFLHNLSVHTYVLGICDAVKIDNRLKFNQFHDDKLTVPIKRQSVFHFILSFLGDCFLVLIVVIIAVFIGFIGNMI